MPGLDLDLQYYHIFQFYPIFLVDAKRREGEGEGGGGRPYSVNLMLKRSVLGMDVFPYRISYG